MAKQKRVSPNKHDIIERKRRTSKKNSEASQRNSSTQDTTGRSLPATPFYPRIEEHAERLSAIPFTAQRNEFIQQLHETYGSRYVQRLMKSVNVQAELTLSSPDDVYEQEADRVADAVTGVINKQVQRQVPEEEEELLQGKLAINRQTPEEEEELMQGKLAVQRQTPEEEEELLQGKPAIHRQTPEEEEELMQGKFGLQRQTPEEEELLQGKIDVMEQTEEEEELQMEPVDNSATAVADDVETRINSARGSGHPLSEDVRDPMEQAFGADFTDVRTHTDSEADTLNKQLNARAFTTGEDIFFREGQYSPGSSAGQHLIAHELTHVVQQTGIHQAIRRDPNGNGDGKPKGELLEEQRPKSIKEALGGIQKPEEEVQVPAEAKKKSFWDSKLGILLKAIGESTWEAIQELVVDLVDKLNIFSAFTAFVKVVSAAREAYKAWDRQKAYKEQASREGAKGLIDAIKYGAKNSARQFKDKVTEVLKETIILINDVIALITLALGGVVTLAAKCINYAISGISWVGKQIKRVWSYIVGGKEKRRDKALVIVNAAVEPGADAADREIAVDLITSLHLATPDEYIELWEEQHPAEEWEAEHEVMRAPKPPKEVDKDVLDWIRAQRGETRNNIKASLTDNVADTMQGYIW